MRSIALLAMVLLIAGCSNTDSDATRVFENAFATPTPPSGVVPLHGYRLERRRFFVNTEEMWRLHLGGPAAKQFVRQRWPDLQVGTPRVFFQGTQTPWFAPGRDVKYFTYISRANPAVTVMETENSEDVFIAYDGL